MRNRFSTSILWIVIIILSLSSGNKALADQTSNLSHENIEMSFKGGGNTSLSWPFDYNDNFFKDSSYIYNHDLAKISLALALSSSPPVSTQIYFGEEGDDIGREQYVKEAFQKLGFTNAKYYLYDKSLTQPGTKAASSIAQKYIEIDGERFSLIVVVPMSHGYGIEWEKNFLIGSDSLYHEGFYEASEKVQEYLRDYLEHSYVNSDEKIKLWLVGYSRGANIVNLAAADINKSFDDDPLFKELGMKRDNFYTYTFGCSRGVMIENNPDFQEENISIFKNIFNVINPADILTILQPSQWGAGRYGVDMVFQVEETANYSPDYDLIDSLYTEISKDIYNARELSAQVRLFEDLEELFSLLIPNSQFYVENLQVTLSRFMMVLNSAVPLEDEPGKWSTTDIKGIFLQLYGQSGQKAYVRSELYLTLLLLKINPKLGLIRIPLKDMYPTIVTVVAMLDINKVKFDLSANEIISRIIELTKIHDISLLISSVQNHYAQSYIFWLFSSDNPDTLYKH